MRADRFPAESDKVLAILSLMLDVRFICCGGIFAGFVPEKLVTQGHSRFLRQEFNHVRRWYPYAQAHASVAKMAGIYSSAAMWFRQGRQRVADQILS